MSEDRVNHPSIKPSGHDLRTGSDLSDTGQKAFHCAIDQRFVVGEEAGVCVVGLDLQNRGSWLQPDNVELGGVDHVTGTTTRPRARPYGENKSDPFHPGLDLTGDTRQLGQGEPPRSDGFAPNGDSQAQRLRRTPPSSRPRSSRLLRDLRRNRAASVGLRRNYHSREGAALPVAPGASRVQSLSSAGVGEVTNLHPARPGSRRTAASRSLLCGAWSMTCRTRSSASRPGMPRRRQR